MRPNDSGLAEGHPPSTVSMTPPQKATDGIDSKPAVARPDLCTAAGKTSGEEEDVRPGEGHTDSGISATVEEGEREVVVTAPARRIVSQSERWDDKQRVDAAPTATMNGNVGAESSNSRDDVGKRGRRIIETEGAVENMRRRLSAMGFLEPGADSDAGGSGKKLRSPDSMSTDSPSGFSSKSKGRLSVAATGTTEVVIGEGSAIEPAVDYDATAADVLMSEPGDVATAGESGTEMVLHANLPRALEGQGGRDTVTASSSAVALSDERSKAKVKVDSDAKDAESRGGNRRVTLDTATPSPPANLRHNDGTASRVAVVLDRRLHMGNDEDGGRGAGKPSYGAPDAGGSGFTAWKTGDFGKVEENDDVVRIRDSPVAETAGDLVVSPTMTGGGRSDSSLKSGLALRSAPPPQPTIATPPRTAAAAILSTGEILPAAVGSSGGGRVSFARGELAGSDGIRPRLAAEAGEGQRMSSWRRLQGGRGLDGEVRLAVLPRPDEEYEKALLNLTAAAAHAAELYRELTEASSGSLSVARESTTTAASGFAKSESSFPVTPPPRNDRERGGGGLGQRDSEKQGEGEGHIGVYLRRSMAAKLQARGAQVVELIAVLPRKNVGRNCVSRQRLFGQVACDNGPAGTTWSLGLSSRSNLKWGTPLWSMTRLVVISGLGIVYMQYSRCKHHSAGAPTHCGRISTVLCRRQMWFFASRHFLSKP